ncbi:hypothetical protein [Rhodanobacter sp. A1T4]|uniref:hypothetical protein n=1 Tax=Rhodanobacter sp. A1T4 TaxID=2723087 RepID=UPI00161D2421|nr:hypothetical protein [Rhodanobacter sp. A1T4]MBB6248948.1 hypothetical protein [Rhodanobacter sp. A1T4]
MIIDLQLGFFGRPDIAPLLRFQGKRNSRLIQLAAIFAMALDGDRTIIKFRDRTNAMLQ